MKLELKHVASYIAYKIKVWDNKTNKPKTLHCTQLNLPIVEDDRYNLILRPLSSLTYNQMTYLENKHGKMTDGYEECKRHFIERTNDLPYDVVISLLELHCDLFGLIESGKAIDINTLNK